MQPDFPFQQFQRELARHLRDPHHVRRPQDVPARRAAVYQDLLFNNIRNSLDACFPVSRELFGQTRWARLARTFYRDWPLHDPLIRHIPREFVAYLASSAPRLRLPAWAAELAHYEWVELAVDIMDIAPGGNAPPADLLDSPLRINPASMSLTYLWPVHRIGPQCRPRKPGATPTHLIVFRDADCRVKFCEVNAVTARLIALIAQGGTGRAALQALAQELQHPDPARLREFGADVLVDLARQGIILAA